MRRFISLFLAFVMCGLFCACNGNSSSSSEVPKVPEEVRVVQRKIDKALESEPTYTDLVEIREMYDDLLAAEQEMILNYDKIENMFSLSNTDVAAIYAVNELKSQLENPSTLTLLSVSATSGDTTIAIKVKYSSDNNVGGTIDDEFFCLVDTPVYDKETDSWSCRLERIYKSSYNLEIINFLLDQTSRGTKSQDYAKEKYLKNKSSEIDVDVEKLKDYASLNIKELSYDN